MAIPGISCMDEFEYGSKTNRHLKAKSGKNRELKKKNKTNNIRLTSVERDYIENVYSDEEVFPCLNEQDLLDSLDKLNFVHLDDNLPSESEEFENTDLISKIYIDRRANDIKIDTCYYSVDNFSQFNRDIKLFLKDSEEYTFETAPAPPEIRRFIHLLGNLYRIKTYSVGKGLDKRTVLQKTDQSGLAFNTRQMDKVIEQGNKCLKWISGESKPKKDDSGRKRNAFSDSKSSKPVDGSVVGGNASPIAEENIGNKMLQKMGWSPGTGLGRESSGITSHIPAIVKTKRTGLV